MKREWANLIGQTFGRLSVVARDPKDNSQGQPRWRCICSCGGETVTTGGHLKSGHSQSCGCVRKERALAKVKKHGATRTKPYWAWLAMKQRCCNPNHKDYRHYGGRGICVCKRWLDSYEAFLSDMGKRPSPEHSIDRIDVNGNYEPSNCRWATIQEQRLNTRRHTEKELRNAQP